MLKSLIFIIVTGLLLYCSADNKSGTTPALSHEPDSLTVFQLGTGTNFKFKGLAIDTENDVAYLGSWDKKEIVAVSLLNQTYEVLTTKYSGKLNGMGCYFKNGILYAVMNEVDDNPGSNPVSVLLLFEAKSRKLIRSYEAVGKNGRNHFNHVIVDDAGRAYVSNTLKSSIFSVNTTDPTDSLTVLVEHPDLSWVHGIDLSADQAKLFTTSYDGGIKFYDLSLKTFSNYRDVRTAGDDGLKYDRGFLYGVGQGSIKRYTLDEAQTKVVKIDTLSGDQLFFNDPRCLQVEANFLYCLANIEFEPVEFKGQKSLTDKKTFDDTYIVRIKVRD
jgi:hypothetical protein